MSFTLMVKYKMLQLLFYQRILPRQMKTQFKTNEQATNNLFIIREAAMYLRAIVDRCELNIFNLFFQLSAQINERLN